MALPFRVIISKDQLYASIDKLNGDSEELSFSLSQLKGFLQENKVVYGLNEEKLERVANNPLAVNYPLQIAEGTPPIHGEDGYLVAEYVKEKETLEEKVNFRDIIEIPSVQKGQRIASIVPPTNGVSGKGVTGREIPAKNGKPVRVRAGKNVTLDGNDLISLIDGQVSMTKNVISVNPVFEVRGDLDMKTGNINFIGNVVIRGNVPTGYQIVAGGDIKIYGLVEGAQLVSRGNIFITGGITGGNRAKIVANGTITANYLNQADVKAGQDVVIQSSCLHSKVEAKGTIDGRNAIIIGGTLLSGRDIHVKELGNHLYTKTEVIVGFDTSLDEEEKQSNEEKEKVIDSMKKLQMLESRILEQMKQRGTVSEEEKSILLKQRATLNQLEEQLNEINEKLEQLEKTRESISNCKVYIYGKVFPNSLLRFGKYSKPIQKEHTFVKFYLSNNEIVFEPLT